MEVLVGAIIMGLLFVCCVFFCALSCYLGCRTPNQGQVIIDGVETKWKVIGSTGTQSSQDSKLRIVWDIDAKMSDPYRLDQQTDQPQVVPFASNNSQSSQKGSPRNSRNALATFACDGQSLEYYSPTRKTWLQAQVENCRPQQHSTVASETLLDLKLGDKFRPSICIAQVRFPLKQGELCEFYSAIDKRWVKAVVTGAQKSFATRSGYCVRLLEAAGAGRVDRLTEIPNLPADRLRRRFEPGSLVEVYRGVEEGWVMAVVVEPPSTASNNDFMVVEGKGCFDGHCLHMSTANFGLSRLLCREFNLAGFTVSNDKVWLLKDHQAALVDSAEAVTYLLRTDAPAEPVMAQFSPERLDVVDDVCVEFLDLPAATDPVRETVPSYLMRFQESFRWQVLIAENLVWFASANAEDQQRIPKFSV